MIQRAQAEEFYKSLSEEERILLIEALADDLYFIDEELSKKILCILHEAEPELAERIRKINDFTM